MVTIERGKTGQDIELGLLPSQRRSMFVGAGSSRRTWFADDDKTDHEELAQGEEPRIDSKNPLAILIRTKPTSAAPVDHPTEIVPGNANAT